VGQINAHNEPDNSERSHCVKAHMLLQRMKSSHKFERVRIEPSGADKWLTDQPQLVGGTWKTVKCLKVVSNSHLPTKAESISFGFIVPRSNMLMRNGDRYNPMQTTQL
jgi:hypothetical protein